MPHEPTDADYAGQQDGVNPHGCPYIVGQCVTNAVQRLDEVLASLGFRSIEELMDAATQM
jgi:hypothetical protein